MVEDPFRAIIKVEWVPWRIASPGPENWPGLALAGGGLTGGSGGLFPPAPSCGTRPRALASWNDAQAWPLKQLTDPTDSAGFGSATSF
jgi:hypothetical protein